MKRGRDFLPGLVAGLALTLGFWGAGTRDSLAQTAVQSGQCSDFKTLSEAAAKRAAAVQAAMKAKVERKEVCTLMTSFVAAESQVVKFLVDNQTWCGVPPQVITTSKTNHEHSVKFQTAACTEGAPERKAPTLSDAIATPKVDSASNTKTGKGGAFDTLMGNPLGK
jgi:hypothetical protein